MSLEDWSFGQDKPDDSYRIDEDLNYPQLRDMGLRHLSEDEYDKAAEHFSTAIERSTLDEHADLLCLKSKTCLVCGNILEAVENGSRCIKEHPGFVQGYVRLCEALFSVGDREKARTVALEGLNFDPLNIDLKDLLGRARTERPNKSFAFFFLQQVIGCSMDERMTVLRSWDKNLKDDSHTAIIECWNAVVLFILSDQAVSVLSPSLSTLLKDILLAGSSSQLVSDICHACYSFDDAQNRGLMLQLSISGWSQLVPLTRSLPSLSDAGYCLCLGHAYQSLPASQPVNVERAISCFRRALLALDPKEFPEPWTAAHLGLGQGYKERFRGDPEDNFSRAIQHFKLSISQPDLTPGSIRRASVLFEIVRLYDAIGLLAPCVEHIDLCLDSLDPERSAQERELKASVHRFAANVFVWEAQVNSGDCASETSAASFDQGVADLLTKAIHHYQQVLQVCWTTVGPLCHRLDCCPWSRKIAIGKCRDP